MAAEQPTIVATSIQFGRTAGSVWDGDAGPAHRLAVKLARAGQHPRICIIATGLGDNPVYLTAFYGAFSRLDAIVSHLALFPVPSVPDIRAHLLRQDLIWVAGGSTSNMLAVWRLHGVDAVLRECWQAGVVLMGTSAGSICWHAAGTTDSFRMPLQPLTDGLGFLPYSNSPHYNSEPQRRPATRKFVAEGVLPDGYATDDGAGLVFLGTTLHEAICVHENARAYSITRTPDGQAVETPLPTRFLGAG
ncbi:MAG TPA: peptidase E [Streptosporangiaceae bacterium]|nr:peptidase E [Streptosporangiaceae bacterium]